MNLPIWLVCSKWGRKRHRGHCHQIRKKCCLAWQPFYARISIEQTRCYTTINFGTLEDNLPRIKFDSMRIGTWDGTDWARYMIDTTIITVGNDCIIYCTIGCTKCWPGIERVCGWNNMNGYIKLTKPELHLFYCKSIRMIVKWHDTPNICTYTTTHALTTND